MEAIKRAVALLIVRGPDGPGSLFQGQPSAQTGVWRIMVPEKDNCGRRFSARENLAWEDAVINISGGWTIQPLATGAWTDGEEDTVQIERMKPVDIICTDEQIKQIVNLTGHRFRQKVVLAYKISEHIIYEPFEMYREPRQRRLVPA